MACAINRIRLENRGGILQEGECRHCQDEDGDPGIVAADLTGVLEYADTAHCLLCGRRYVIETAPEGS